MIWPQLACPDCRTRLGPSEVDARPELRCEACGRVYRRTPRPVSEADSASGLLATDPAPSGPSAWDFRPTTPRIQRFLSEYEAVRAAEGRGRDVAMLRDLPWPDPGHPLAWEWYIRAASFDCLVEQVLSLDPGIGLRVLDLGAGQAWLSRRLALLGHRPVAVDLSSHPTLGLGAAGLLQADLPAPFPTLLADFDRLPLADHQADLVVYNASFHYSSDYGDSLREALRVLAPGGRIVIMDSPVYRDAAAGAAMRSGRRSDYLSRYGFASDALDSREFLAVTEIHELGRQLGLTWTWISPRHGRSWRWHRLRRRLATGRESADFPLLLAHPSSDRAPA